MKLIAGVLLAIVIIIAVNAVLETNQKPKLRVLPRQLDPKAPFPTDQISAQYAASAAERAKQSLEKLLGIKAAGAN